MARLGNVQLKNAKKLIHEGGDLGLRSLYEKAKMPERLFSAVRAAVQILAEEDYDGGRNDRERFVSRIIERLLTQFVDPAPKITQEDIDYLKSKLRQDRKNVGKGKSLARRIKLGGSRLIKK